MNSIDEAKVPVPVEVEGLSKAYGPRQALSDVSLRVRAGSVMGLLGPNGSGKTTTIKCLLGLAKPDSGMTRVFGRAYKDLPNPGRRVGVVYERAGLLPGLSASAHVRVCASSLGLGDVDVDAVLDSVGLDGAGGLTARRMSLGMRQRLALALARLGGPDVLVLDEPANGLDPAANDALRAQLRGHADAGGAVLITSHLLSELELFVDDVVILDRGRVVMRAARDEFRKRGELERLYLNVVGTDYRAGATA